MNVATKKLLPLLIALALAGASDATAQTTANATASITIGQVLYLDVTGLAVNFAPTAADFQNGFATTTDQSTITHAGNVAHDVEIQADNAFFTAGSTGTDSSKPAGDLQWSANGGAFTSVSTTAVDVVTAAVPGLHSNAVTVDYQVLLDYATDTQDTYTLGFTYTVVAN